MWLLAQPLIENWMWENRGPEARLRDAVGDAMSGLERLPQLVRKAEAAVDALSADHTSRIGGEWSQSRGRPSRWVVQCLILIALIVLVAKM